MLFPRQDGGVGGLSCRAAWHEDRYPHLHLFNHQTHRRGQATSLLFQAGLDVGVTDLLALIPEEPTV
jgi:hypothetical protein